MAEIEQKINMLMVLFTHIYQEKEHKMPSQEILDYIRVKAVAQVLSEYGDRMRDFQEHQLRKLPTTLDHDTKVNGILDGYIRAHVTEHGRPPSAEEIAEVKREIEEDVRKFSPN